jgi:uncharacterized protein YfbU (UPF0304 family)
MWYFLERSYADLSPEGKQQVQTGTGRTEVGFIEFDGNNENHYGIARYLVDDLERFEHFKGRDLNSHISLVDDYRSMFHVFEPMRRTLVDRLLNAAEIIEIMNARRN